MSTPADAPPALPEALTLRDWFAGQALARLATYWEGTETYINPKIPRLCYDFAEAMLEERGRRKKNDQ